MISKQSVDANYWFSRACGFHRGVMPNHICGNPTACGRVLEKARGSHRRVA